MYVVGTVGMQTMATILHADLDAFYASVEQLLDPSLRGKPIAVGGGVVLAASYEARAFGVRGGMPGRRARELCPQLRFVSGRFKEYQRLGDAANKVVSDFTPVVERLSIDEAFAGAAMAVASGTAIAVADGVAEICAVTFAWGLAFYEAGGVGGVGFVTGVVVVVVLSDIAIRHQRQGVFLLLYVFALTIGCLSAANGLSGDLIRWTRAGSMMLFLGLLTLINAPFDWVSLGLTRALLRRGLELGGWWPYFLALADAVAAAVIIALLAVTMVIGVHTFDHLAEHGGGGRISPLEQLFDGIATNPSAPEYWWVYALLLRP
jgi:hypothetical protein